MLDVYKELVAHQYEASLVTLGLCIEACPEGAWDAAVANRPFCQVVFHTLFFADYYLSENEAAQREQAFHRERAEFFRNYDELVSREPQLLYERSDVNSYLAHCLNKSARVVGAETEASLAAPCGFPRKEFTRAEVHVYNIRHIQHHAAQLSLRLRLDFGTDIRWVRSGAV